MQTLVVIRRALTLLAPRDHGVLALLILVQAMLALLDLAGILLLGAVAALATAQVSGQPTNFMAGFTERFGLLAQPSALLIVSAIAGGLLITKSALSYVAARKTFRYLANRQADMSARLARSLLAQPLLVVQARSSQQTSYALTRGVNAVTLGVVGQAAILASETAVLVIIALGMALLSPLLSLSTLLYFLFVGWLLHRLLSSWAQHLGSRAAATEVASNTAMQDAVRAYREIAVSGRRGMYVDRFSGLRQQAAGVQSEMRLLGMVSKYVFEVALVIGAALVVASQLTTQTVTKAVGLIAVFLVAGTRMMPTLLRVQTALLAIKTARGEAESTLELASELAGSHPPSSTQWTSDVQLRERVALGLRSPFDDFEPNIDVRDVSLRYPAAESGALSHVGLTVAAGTSLALVGASGAGKSTLTDLILGVLIPDEGDVRVGGMAAYEAIHQWPGALAYVPQDITLVDGSVRDNVTLGLPDELISDDQVWGALEQAQLSEFLGSQRDGLDTVVGERGIRLSGGQRQRLGLARALYTRPKLLVLDEATSALDADTERAVAQQLVDLGATATRVIVAHRLATVRECDQIAFLDSGRVLAQGTFSEVRSVVPAFDRQAALLGL